MMKKIHWIFRCLLIFYVITAYPVSAQTTCSNPKVLVYDVPYTGTPFKGVFTFDDVSGWDNYGGDVVYYCFEVNGHSFEWTSSSHAFPGTNGITVDSSNPQYESILAAGEQTMKIYMSDSPFTVAYGDACDSGGFTPSLHEWSLTNVQLELTFSGVRTGVGGPKGGTGNGEFLTQWSGYDFYTVVVQDALTDTNGYQACIDNGLQVPCINQQGGSYSDYDCVDVGWREGGNPMSTLSQHMCGTYPNNCPNFYGVYQYMGHKWSGDSTCGVDINGHGWCDAGSSEYGKKMLCVYIP